MAWLLCFYFLLAAVSIRVLPQVLLANQSVRITCAVPHRAENRKLVIAVEGYRESEYALDGESAPGVFQRVYDFVPCGVDAASCSVTESNGKTTRAALPLYVSGCDR